MQHQRTLSPWKSWYSLEWPGENAQLMATRLEEKEKSGTCIQQFSGVVFFFCQGASLQTDFCLTWLGALTELAYFGCLWSQKTKGYSAACLLHQRISSIADRHQCQQEIRSSWKRNCKFLYLGNYIHKLRKEVSPGKILEDPRISNQADWWSSSPAWNQFTKIGRGGCIFKCTHHSKK